MTRNDFLTLEKTLEGELFIDDTMRRLYATDASAYRELPTAVALPKNDSDLIKLIRFATEHKTSLIPRTAGTSLAGQVVGAGIVVDVSKYFNQIIEVNVEQQYAWVQPGIVRDDLNQHLKQFGLFFAPETSTANRAMIGGMIGNNSCGSNSVVYGSTREHLLEVKALLADGTAVSFGALPSEEFDSMTQGEDLHHQLYRHAKSMLSNDANRREIEKQFPKASITRRNTGYAIDLLARMSPFTAGGPNFNFASLVAGSEGTLCLVTAAKLKLSPIEPPFRKLVCIHCKSIDESLHANLVALQFNPSAVELMDHYVFEATKRNIGQKENRFFIEGDPMAILVAELTRSSEAEVNRDAAALIDTLKAKNLGYSYPIVSGDDIKKVWNLRKAGLGLLSNLPGDVKPVPVIEDTAVDVNDLPAYIADINVMLRRHGLYSVHYAHAGTGELHLRPYIDLKQEEGVKLFRTVAEETAALVKKYDGSLSGEHGDGRLRGEFIPMMIGEHNYRLIRVRLSTPRRWIPSFVLKKIRSPRSLILSSISPIRWGYSELRNSVMVPAIVARQK